MTAWDGLNRRKFPRVMYPCLVTIRHEKGEKQIILTHTENIGIGGICVILKNSIKMFAPVEVEMDMLDMDEHIVCPGRIVWSVRRKDFEQAKPSQYDIGIEFVDLLAANQKRIEVIVKKLVLNKMTV